MKHSACLSIVPLAVCSGVKASAADLLIGCCRRQPRSSGGAVWRRLGLELGRDSRRVNALSALLRAREGGARIRAERWTWPPPISCFADSGSGRTLELGRSERTINEAAGAARPTGSSTTIAESAALPPSAGGASGPGAGIQGGKGDLEIGQPINSENRSETAEGVTRESEGRSRLSLLRAALLPPLMPEARWTHQSAQLLL
jgi:hypothetical protein